MQFLHYIEQHIDKLKEKAIQLGEQSTHTGAIFLKKQLDLILKELNILVKMAINGNLTQDNLVNKIKLIEMELSWIENELR
jgi:hypothetical protein